MNGNANLNANNLTPQNVVDWREKLGVPSEPTVETATVPTQNTNGGSINVAKYGRVCVLTVNDITMNYIGTYTGRDIGTIPEGFRPIQTFISDFGAEGNGAQSLLYVHTNGTLALNSWGTTISAGKHIATQIVYICQ